MNLIDENERTRALSSLDENLAIEAAAGTGKTALLVGRVCKLLASGREPRHIVAITFTDPSASELATRVARMTKQLIKGEVPKELGLAFPAGIGAVERSNLERATIALDELTTSTIHGFCQEIIRTYSIDAGLDPGASVIDAHAADALFEVALSEWLMEKLSIDQNGENPVVVLARHIPLDVIKLLRELASIKRSYPRATAAAPKFELRPDVDFCSAVSAFEQWFATTPGERSTAEIIEQLRGLAEFYTESFADRPSFESLWTLAHPPRYAIMRWNALEFRQYDKAGAWRRSCGSEMGLGYFERASEYYLEVETAYQQLLGVIGAGLASALATDLDSLLSKYQERKRLAAALDFDDLLNHARDLIRQYPPVRRALGEQYRYLLIDEFQDTDPIQAEIIFRISDRGDSVDWRDATPRDGSLFLVGDPKQAIYRFRGADIATYEQAVGIIRQQNPECVLRITTNFRSRPAILAHVNRCFARVFDGTVQPAYVDLSPSPNACDDSWSGVKRIRVDVESADPAKSPRAEEQREAEATLVAQMCKQLIGSTVSSDDGARRLVAGDIALLSPGHTGLWQYERALESSGISVASQAGKTLMLRQETQDILCLLRALADPFDTLALGALLRGPLVGLTDEEILDLHLAIQSQTALDEVRHGLSLNTSVEHINHPVARRVMQQLQYLRRRAQETTPKALLSEAIERLLLRTILAARHSSRGARALANLEMLMERADSYAVRGLRAFVASLQEDWEQQAAHAEGRIDEAAAAVQIVTVHSSKGQEWPIVIPINMGTMFRRPPEFVHLQTNNSLHWVIGGVASPTLAQARQLEQDAEARQRERLWYVACTRARDLLIIPDLPSAAAETWIRAVDLRHDSLSEWQKDHSEFVSDKPQVAALVNDQDSSQFGEEARIVEASSPPVHWIVPSDHDADLTTPVIAVSVHSMETVEVADLAGPGAIRGLVLHKLFEEVLNGELIERQLDCQSRAATLLRQLISTPVNVQVFPDSLEIAETCLKTLAHPGLSQYRTRLQPEYMVWRAEGDKYLAGRADAVAFDGQVVDLVVDWKSDVAPTTYVREAYRAQLGEYMRATKALKGAIVYASLGEIEWVGATPDIV